MFNNGIKEADTNAKIVKVDGCAHLKIRFGRHAINVDIKRQLMLVYN